MRRPLLLLSLLVLFVPVLEAQIGSQPGDLTPHVYAAEVKAALDRNDAVIIDVRGDVPYEIEHIEGSISMPLGLIDARAAELPKEKLIVAYCTCKAEELSGEATLKLRKAGFTRVGALQGGMKAWKAAGFGVVKSTEPFFVPAAEITPAPVARGRMMPPALIRCERNDLTSFTGVVTSYKRARGKMTVVISTDDGTVETFTFKGSKRAQLEPLFLVESAKFSAADWPRIERREGILRAGVRAVVWVCSAPSKRTWIDWQPPVTSSH